MRYWLKPFIINLIREKEIPPSLKSKILNAVRDDDSSGVLWEKVAEGELQQLFPTLPNQTTVIPKK